MAGQALRRDIFSWSRLQADLLRRLARGGWVDDTDWAHIVEEIEDVELSEPIAGGRFLLSMPVQ